jgi:hypothetical protein
MLLSVFNQNSVANSDLNSSTKENGNEFENKTNNGRTPLLSLIFGMWVGLLFGILFILVSKPIVSLAGYVAIDFGISGIADQIMSEYSAYGGSPIMPLFSIIIIVFFGILLLISFIAIYLYAGLWSSKIMQKTMIVLGSDKTVTYRTICFIIPLVAFVFAFYFVEIDLAKVWKAIETSHWKEFFLEKNSFLYYIPQALAPLCFFIGIVKQGEP